MAVTIGDPTWPCMMLVAADGWSTLARSTCCCRSGLPTRTPIRTAGTSPWLAILLLAINRHVSLPLCEILRAYLTKLASFFNRTQEETALRECAEEIGRLQAARSCMLAVCQSWPKTTLLKSLGGKFVGTVCALAIPTIRA